MDLRAAVMAARCGESLGSCLRHQSSASGSVEAMMDWIVEAPVAALSSKSAKPSACAFSLVRILSAATSPDDARLTRMDVNDSRVIVVDIIENP